MFREVYYSYLAHLLALADRYRYTLWITFPTFKIPESNPSILLFSPSVMDVSRFRGFRNALLNMPIPVNRKLFSVTLKFRDKDGNVQERKVDLDFTVIDESIVVNDATIPLDDFIRDKKDKPIGLGDFLNNAYRKIQPHPAVPPVLMKREGLYLLFPVYVFNVEYTPKSIKSKDDALFQPKGMNIDSIVFGGVLAGLLASELGESSVLSSVMKFFSSPEKDKGKMTVQEAVDACFLEDNEVEGEEEGGGGSLLLDNLSSILSVNPELIYAIGAGRVWKGMEYPSSSLKVTGTIVDVVGIKVQYLEESPITMFPIPESVFLHLLQEKTIVPLSELATSKEEYLLYFRKTVIRNLILPKFLLEVAKSYAARTTVTFTSDETTLLHTMVISNSSVAFKGVDAGGVPTEFTIDVSGSDVGFGTIREVREFQRSFVQRMLTNLVNTLREIAGTGEDETLVRKLFQSVWFGGFRPEMDVFTISLADAGASNES